MLLEERGFEFDEFFLDTKERVLLRSDKPVPITPKILQLLLVLVENHGHIVEKRVLMELVWPDSFVEESNLTFTMRQLRKVLGDDKRNPIFIETIPRRGYRFIGKVKPSEILNNGTNGHDVRPKSTQTPENASVSRQPRPVLLLTLTALLACAVLLSGGFFIWRGESGKPQAAAFDRPESVKFETLASANQPITATISPDGKYIAYTGTVDGEQSLWLRQLSTGINTKIVAPERGTIFRHLEFTSDAGQIYFTSQKGTSAPNLHRVSIFGGAVKADVITNLDGTFDLSPDDRRISFRRYEPRKRKLLIANIDGSDARTIYETERTFTDNVFSPDGKTIAFAMGQSDTGERDFTVYIIDPETGVAKPATDFKWFHVRSIVWLPDQNGLLVTARMKNDEPHGIWQISLPDGSVKKITEAQNDFVSLRAAADLSNLLTVQIALSSSLYISSLATPDKVRPVADQAYDGVQWTPNGDLVFSSTSSGTADVWHLDTKTADQKQLTSETSTDYEPTASPDGRYIVFSSDRDGVFNLWRMDSDGNNLTKLTSGDGERDPVFTADGQFVLFNSIKRGMSLWKVPIGGGETEQISEQRSSNIAISPDNISFAHFGKTDDVTKIFVRSFGSEENLRVFDLPEKTFPAGRVVWTKDGQDLIYAAEDTNLVGNLWLQPLAGGPPQKLTNFTTDEIFAFDLSPEGSDLAIIRGTWNHNVVLARELLK